MVRKRKYLVLDVLIVVLLYLAVSSTVYRFQHPEMTETELFLRLPDAVLWRA